MKAGIVCDNYKLPKFKEALDAEKYVYTIEPGANKTTIIKVLCAQWQVGIIADLCSKIEHHFAKQKAKNN